MDVRLNSEDQTRVRAPPVTYEGNAYMVQDLFNSSHLITTKTRITISYRARFTPIRALNFFKVISSLFKRWLEYMCKEACRTPFPSHNILIGSWYVSQLRVHYQVFLNHRISVLDIKHVMIVNQTLGEVLKLCFLKDFHSHLDYDH